MKAEVLPPKEEPTEAVVKAEPAAPLANGESSSSSLLGRVGVKTEPAEIKEENQVDAMEEDEYDNQASDDEARVWGRFP